MKITVMRRRDDWIAYLNEDPTRWSTGKTTLEAIGSLITSHQQEIGIAVIFE